MSAKSVAITQCCDNNEAACALPLDTSLVCYSDSLLSALTGVVLPISYSTTEKSLSQTISETLSVCGPLPSYQTDNSTKYICLSSHNNTGYSGMICYSSHIVTTYTYGIDPTRYSTTQLKTYDPGIRVVLS